MSGHHMITVEGLYICPGAETGTGECLDLMKRPQSERRKKQAKSIQMDKGEIKMNPRKQ